MSSHKSKRTVSALALETLEGRTLLSMTPMASRVTKPAIVEVMASTEVSAEAVTARPKVPGVKLNQLVGTVAALSIKNTTNNVVNYQLRWSPNGQWVQYSLQPGVTRSHFQSLPLSAALPRPTIRFDKSFNSGFQEQLYGLNTIFQNENARTNFYLGKEYLFKSVTNGVQLYAKA